MSKFYYSVSGRCQDTYHDHVLNTKIEFCKSYKVQYDEKKSYERLHLGFYNYRFKFIITCENEVEAKKITSKYYNMEFPFNKEFKESLIKID